jgi:hypothetical protein
MLPGGIIAECMREIRRIVLIGLLAASLPGRSLAQEDCLDRLSQYTTSLMSILRAVQPLTSSNNRGQRCAGWDRHIRAHQELLRKFEAETAECRNSELGKTLVETLQEVIRQGEDERQGDRCGPTRR